MFKNEIANHLLKIFAFVISFLFLFFSLVQVNDPDPLIWILLYLVVVVFSLLVAFKKYNYKIAGVLGIVYLAAAVYLFPYSVHTWISAEQASKSFGMHMPMVEEAREALGLFLSGIILIIYFVYGRALKNKT